jgi:DNA-binding transcriptional ArsR family regulator
MNLHHDRSDMDSEHLASQVSSILPRIDEPMDDATWTRIRTNAQTASDFLKAISHEGRLMILCALANGEKSVAEIETMLASRQAAVSQQLSRLRLEGLVTARRDGKQIYYRLTDDRARLIIERVYELFCT